MTMQGGGNLVDLTAGLSVEADDFFNDLTKGITDLEKLIKLIDSANSKSLKIPQVSVPIILDKETKDKIFTMNKEILEILDAVKKKPPPFTHPGIKEITDKLDVLTLRKKPVAVGALKSAHLEAFGEALPKYIKFWARSSARQQKFLSAIASTIENLLANVGRLDKKMHRSLIKTMSTIMESPKTRPRTIVSELERAANVAGSVEFRWRDLVLEALEGDPGIKIMGVGESESLESKRRMDVVLKDVENAWTHMQLGFKSPRDVKGQDIAPMLELFNIAKQRFEDPSSGKLSRTYEKIERSLKTKRPAMAEFLKEIATYLETPDPDKKKRMEAFDRFFNKFVVLAPGLSEKQAQQVTAAYTGGEFGKRLSVLSESQIPLFLKALDLQTKASIDPSKGMNLLTQSNAETLLKTNQDELISRITDRVDEVKDLVKSLEKRKHTTGDT